MNTEEILSFDKVHVWHPYASMRSGVNVYPVESASGAVLKLTDGHEIYDGMSSWWAVAYGYNNPHINAAVEAQLHKMSHVMFGGLTHEPAVELARRLVDMTPSKLQKVFFCDSGSVSVEVAMKMALQYWRAVGNFKKTKFATARGGYHGDTWHAMSVCDPVGGMHSLFAGGLPINFFAEIPNPAFGDEFNSESLNSMRSLLFENADEIAAVVIEPIVQGAGGMRFYHPEYLSGLRRLCDEFGILLILDEIATGFGRSGKTFACEYADVQPDIMCLGKALTGGYLSFAATLATDLVADAISDSAVGAFMHGPTFMGNPLACSAANAAIDLFYSINALERVAEIEKLLKAGLSPLSDCASVADVRVLGAIGVVEMRDRIDVGKAQEFLVGRGVWLRPFGRLLYAMPPYISSDSQIEQLCSAMSDYAKGLA